MCGTSQRNEGRGSCRIIRTFRSAEITAAGLDLDNEGLRGPSSTWTYLINDNPFGDVLQRLFRGLVRSVRNAGKT